jgi:hypothetical protein
MEMCDMNFEDDGLRVAREKSNAWLLRYQVRIVTTGLYYSLRDTGNQEVLAAPLTVGGLLYLLSKASLMYQDPYRQLPELG